METIQSLYLAIARRYRPRRMRAFAEHFSVTSRTRVLDIGGTHHNWLWAPVEPKVTLLNLEPRHVDCPERFSWIQGDALRQPYDPRDFDIVFSNSVIEHVGGWAEQQRFANAIRSTGLPYWVQTPNWGFPIEPHFLGVGVQFLPRFLAIPYVRYATVWGWRAQSQHREVPQLLDAIRLLSSNEVRKLFPEATIIRERAAGLVKSIIATSQR